MSIQIMLARLSLLALIVLPAGNSLFADEQQATEYRRPSADGARVGFVNLQDGAVVPPTFSVQFSITGMDIAPAGTDTKNTGHHHLLIDVAELPDFNLPLPKNEHFVHFGGGQTEVTLTLPEGEHTLQLLLADYAHIPHQPAVKSETIHIRVSATAPPQESHAEKP